MQLFDGMENLVTKIVIVYLGTLLTQAQLG
jgi:hypothetical protein